MNLPSRLSFTIYVYRVLHLLPPHQIGILRICRLCSASIAQTGSCQRAALLCRALITSSHLVGLLIYVYVWRRPGLPLQETEQLVRAGKPHSLAGGWTFEGRPPDQLARVPDLPQTYQVGYVISAFSAHLTHPLLG